MNSGSTESESDIHITSVVMAMRETGAVGPKTFQSLLWVFGSPENVYDATIDDLVEIPRISEERAARILESRHNISAMTDRLGRLREEGTNVVTFLDDHYPEKLRGIDDPPPLLYYRGSLPDPEACSICIIGTTEASAEGIQAAVEIASELVKRNCAVVSGLARGIDTAAHIGALKNNGITHAVLGCGFSNIFPEENISLSKEILERGSLISEYPPDTTVNRGRLLSRNRIVVGLSDSAIIAELSRGSPGVQSAAQLCDRQGKLIFYFMRGDEEKRGIEVPDNAVSFETLADIRTILENSIGS
jgi:DNA processing protein